MKRGSWLVLTMVLSAVALGLFALKLRPPPPSMVNPPARPATVSSTAPATVPSPSPAQRP